ncbi:PAS domain-containing protein [Marivita sp. S0852]|uniref:PAS domain-containing protein n=1 Tax=Marivita sp. S0852 TaxID=3373893 RepID=UPI0039822317
MQQAYRALVGIGASAGGLEALQQFVQAIPKDSDIAFVIVQHLAPDHPSIMDKLLAAHAKVDVRQIQDGDPIQADVVHVIPPGPFLEISDGRFKLHDHAREEGVRTPIDRFFTSLANESGRKAFGIVLSGTGSDGTLGVRAIKSAGGATMVQESKSARFPGMPDSAAATGLVDFVLRPSDMPDRILDILDYREQLESGTSGEDINEDILSALDDLLDLLDPEQQHGFKDYKPPTLVRRVQRRLSLLRQPSVEKYIEKLKSDPEERNTLIRDFLIGVTEFFRDPEIYDIVRKRAIRDIVASDAESLRVWVPGCSTGEEAYSLAIVFLEEMARQDRKRPLQIFGTDVDINALRHARIGAYTKSALTHVSDTQLNQYFSKDNGSYRIISAIREICVFAPHNLLRDPPFSRLDMISCRNVMIYLTGDAQKTVLPRFHYGLVPKGILLLGPSETLGRNDDLFESIDRNARVFRRNDSTKPRFTALDGSPMSRGISRPLPIKVPQSLSNGDAILPQTLEQRAEQTFLQQHASPFAVVDARGGIQYLSEAMTRFVRPVSGAPEMTTDSLLSRELRLPVHAVLSESRDTGTQAEVQNVVVERDGTTHLFDISAAPMPEGSGGHLVVLHEVRQREGHEITLDADQAASAAVVQRELTLANRRLETVEREFASATQEAQSANEELLSMNEELQSANEELETSREELQSINEELETINAELTENNRQLSRANSDLKNFLESTDIATLFLDADLRVRRFTPALSELYGVRERDLGREIADLAARVDYPELAEDAAHVLETLQPFEREVHVPKTRQSFQVQVKPYRTIDDRLDGTVITFIDITRRKHNEQQLKDNARVLREQYAELETLYDSTPVGLSLMDRELRWLRINSELAAINGFPVEDHIGVRQSDLIPDIDSRISDIQMQVLTTGDAIRGIEVTGETPAEPGVSREWIVDYYPIKDGDETFAVGTCVREITDARRMEREAVAASKRAEESAARLHRIFGATPAFIAMLEGPDHVFTYCNPQQLTFFEDREQLGRPLAEAFPELRELGLYDAYDQVFTTGEALEREEFEATFGQPGSEKTSWFSQTIQPWFDEDGNVGGVVTYAFEVTELVNARKEQETWAKRLKASEARMARLFDQAPAIISIFEGPEHRYIYTNPLHDKVMGRSDLIGKPMREAMPELEGQGIFKRIEQVWKTGEPSLTDELPAKLEGPDGSTTYYQQIIQPWFDEKGAVAGTMSFNTDITDLVVAREALRTTTHRLAGIQNSLGSFLGLLNTDGVLLEANEHALTAGNLDREDVIGKPFWDGFWWQHDPDQQQELQNWVAEAATGKTVKTECTIQVAGGNKRVLELKLVPNLDDDGSVKEIVPSGIDITPYKEAEARKDTLLAELQHRVKNSLATVQAITRFTERHSDTKADLVASLSQRLAAISRTNDALTRTDWSGQSIYEIIQDEMAAYVDIQSDRLVLEGKDVVVDADKAQSLSLGIHELTTNAAKYGALKNDTGQVRVTITSANGMLKTLEWQESGGPKVTPPAQEGFGSFLLKRILPEDFCASVEMDYNPEGFRCKIVTNDHKE